MRAPPPFAVRTRPLPGLNRMGWLLAGIAASISVHWAGGQFQWHAAWQGMAWALPIVAGLLGAARAGLEEPLTITWDGQSWRLQGGSAGTPVLALDMGAWLLMRWQSPPGGPPRRWIQTRIAAQNPGETRLKVMLLHARAAAGDIAPPAAESRRP